MTSRLVLRERTQLGDDRFVEIIIWEIPSTVRGSSHSYKYRLAFVVDEICVVRYDNEAGKGDHKHVGMNEQPYRFITVDRLLNDFRDDVLNWRSA